MVLVIIVFLFCVMLPNYYSNNFVLFHHAIVIDCALFILFLSELSQEESEDVLFKQVYGVLLVRLCISEFHFHLFPYYFRYLSLIDQSFPSIIGLWLAEILNIVAAVSDQLFTILNNSMFFFSRKTRLI